MWKFSAGGTEALVGFKVVSGVDEEESAIDSARKSSPNSWVFIYPVAEFIELATGRFVRSLVLFFHEAMLSLIRSLYFSKGQG